jgi:hypothetical protein
MAIDLIKYRLVDFSLNRVYLSHQCLCFWALLALFVGKYFDKPPAMQV